MAEKSFPEGKYKLLDALLFERIGRAIDEKYEPPAAPCLAAAAYEDYEEHEDKDESVCGVQSFDNYSPGMDRPVFYRKKAYASQSRRRLEDLLKNKEETFSEMVLRLIDEKGYTDVEVYRRALLDRRVFSRVRRPDYVPSRGTAIALAIALRLNLDETRDLLAKAGFALSHSSRSDIIIEYFIAAQDYNIDRINEALDAFEETPLGA